MLLLEVVLVIRDYEFSLWFYTRYLHSLVLVLVALLVALVLLSITFLDVLVIADVLVHVTCVVIVLVLSAHAFRSLLIMIINNHNYYDCCCTYIEYGWPGRHAYCVLLNANC